MKGLKKELFDMIIIFITLIFGLIFLVLVGAGGINLNYSFAEDDYSSMFICIIMIIVGGGGLIYLDIFWNKFSKRINS